MSERVAYLPESTQKLVAKYQANLENIAKTLEVSVEEVKTAIQERLGVSNENIEIWRCDIQEGLSIVE